jgi:hypothetical protein
MDLMYIVDHVRVDSRRSLENSLLAAVGISIVGLAAFISQVAGQLRDLAASSLPALRHLTVLFFVLLFAKVMNMTLEALFDSRKRRYGIGVFIVWAVSLAVAAGGLAWVAYSWHLVLSAWAGQR